MDSKASPTQQQNTIFVNTESKNTTTTGTDNTQTIKIIKYSLACFGIFASYYFFSQYVKRKKAITKRTKKHRCSKLQYNSNSSKSHISLNDSNSNDLSCSTCKNTKSNYVSSRIRKKRKIESLKNRYKNSNNTDNKKKHDDLQITSINNPLNSNITAESNNNIKNSIIISHDYNKSNSTAAFLKNSSGKFKKNQRVNTEVTFNPGLIKQNITNNSTSNKYSNTNNTNVTQESKDQLKYFNLENVEKQSNGETAIRKISRLSTCNNKYLESDKSFGSGKLSLNKMQNNIRKRIGSQISEYSQDFYTHSINNKYTGSINSFIFVVDNVNNFMIDDKNKKNEGRKVDSSSYEIANTDHLAITNTQSFGVFQNIQSNINDNYSKDLKNKSKSKIKKPKTKKHLERVLENNHYYKEDIGLFNYNSKNSNNNFFSPEKNNIVPPINLNNVHSNFNSLNYLNSNSKNNDILNYANFSKSTSRFNYNNEENRSKNLLNKNSTTQLSMIKEMSNTNLNNNNNYNYNDLVKNYDIYNIKHVQSQKILSPLLNKGLDSNLPEEDITVKSQLHQLNKMHTHSQNYNQQLNNNNENKYYNNLLQNSSNHTNIKLDFLNKSWFDLEVNYNKNSNNYNNISLSIDQNFRFNNSCDELENNNDPDNMGYFEGVSEDNTINRKYNKKNSYDFNGSLFNYQFPPNKANEVSDFQRNKNRMSSKNLDLLYKRNNLNENTDNSLIRKESVYSNKNQNSNYNIKEDIDKNENGLNQVSDGTRKIIRTDKELIQALNFFSNNINNNNKEYKETTVNNDTFNSHYDLTPLAQYSLKEKESNSKTTSNNNDDNKNSSSATEINEYNINNKIKFKQVQNTNKPNYYLETIKVTINKNTNVSLNSSISQQDISGDKTNKESFLLEILPAKKLVIILEFIFMTIHPVLIEISDFYVEQRRRYFRESFSISNNSSSLVNIINGEKEVLVNQYKESRDKYFQIISSFLKKKEEFFLCVLYEVMVHMNISKKILDNSFMYYMNIVDSEDKEANEVRLKYSEVYNAGVKR